LSVPVVAPEALKKRAEAPEERLRTRMGGLVNGQEGWNSLRQGRSEHRRTLPCFPFREVLSVPGSWV
jgi:hypothetical protein